MIKTKWFVLTVALLWTFALLIGVAGADPINRPTQPVEIVRSLILQVIGDVKVTNTDEDPLPVTGDVSIVNEDPLSVTGDVSIVNEDPLSVLITNDSLTVSDISGTVDVSNLPTISESVARRNSGQEAMQVAVSGIMTPMTRDGSGYINPTGSYHSLEPGQTIHIFFDASNYSKVYLSLDIIGKGRFSVLDISRWPGLHSYSQLKMGEGSSSDSHRLREAYEVWGNEFLVFIEAEEAMRLWILAKGVN